MGKRLLSQDYKDIVFETFKIKRSDIIDYYLNVIDEHYDNNKNLCFELERVILMHQRWFDEQKILLLTKDEGFEVQDLSIQAIPGLRKGKTIFSIKAPLKSGLRLGKYIEGDFFEYQLKVIRALPDIIKQKPSTEKTDPTLADQLKPHLEKYGFFELEKVKALSQNKQDELMALISEKKNPYRITMFDFLGFIDHLTRKYFPYYNDRNKKLGEILSIKADTVKKAIPLNTYQETVKKDYEKIKKG